MLARRRRRARRGAAPRRSPPRAGGARHGAAAASCSAQAARAAGHRRRGRLDGAGRRRRRRASPRPSASPSPRSFRCQDYLDNDSPAYAGHAGLGDGPGAGRAHAARPTCCSRRRPPRRDPVGRLHAPARRGRPRQRLVHVHPDPDELGAVYQPELAIVAGLEAFAAAAPARSRRRAPTRARRRCSRRRAASTSATSPRRASCPGALQMSAVMATLRERCRADAILTNGAGNFSVWAHRYYEFRRYGDAARAAQRLDGLRRPGRGRRQGRAPRPPGRLPRRRRRLPDDRPGARDRGAGGAADRRARGQQRHVRHDPHAPGAPLSRAASSAPTCATPTSSPTRGRSARTARWSSAPRTSAAALDEALACGRPALIELRVDPQAITPRQTLDEIRAAAS